MSRYSKDITSKTLLQFDEPVSPHIAARSSKEVNIVLSSVLFSGGRSLLVV